MTDLREVFEMTVKQMGEPDLDSWQEQQKRQRQANRNKRLGAIAVAAVLLIAAVVGGISALGRDEGIPPATSGSPIPEPGTQTLSIVNVDSGAATSFMAPAGAFDFDVSRDGSMIAFAGLDENGTAQVFVMDADGSDVRQLTHGKWDIRNDTLDGCPCSGLSWSPDGSMIAYQRETSDVPQIFTVRVSDEVSTRVTNEPDGAVIPGGWTPDGGSVVYMTPNYAINHYTAMSVDLETGQTTQVVPDGSGPELSPDGAMIAFNSWLKPSAIRLFLADGDGSDRRLVARLDGADGAEEWSPDSTRLAFAGTLHGEFGFGTYVYDLATGETRLVTERTLETWIDNDHILVS